MVNVGLQASDEETRSRIEIFDCNKKSHKHTLVKVVSPFSKRKEIKQLLIWYLYKYLK